MEMVEGDSGLKFIEIRFSPQAKNFLKWVNTHLAIAAAAAPFLWDNWATAQLYVPQWGVKWLQAAILLGMIYNSVRAKK